MTTGRRIVVFGAGSLVGSDFVEAAGARYDIFAVGRTDPRTLGLSVKQFVPIDLSDGAALGRFLSSRRAEADAAWVNFAARTDVDGCEKERPKEEDFRLEEVDRSDSAWRLNAVFPGILAEEAKRLGVPLFHLSTDFVFDGTDGPYAEEAPLSPLSKRIGWYGFTKGVGEERVRARLPDSSAVVRISYPYRASFPRKTDFARSLLERARKGDLYSLYEDQRITPTWIPDVTKLLLALLDRGAKGIYHVASPQATTPLEFGSELLKAFGIDAAKIRSGRLGDMAPSSGKAPRPLHGGLLVRRASEVGVTSTGFREGIARMAAELRSTR